MENKVANGLIVLILFFSLSNYVVAGELEFSLRLGKKGIELVAENSSDETIYLPWLKRGGAAFILVTLKGELVPDRNWSLLSRYGYRRGRKFICPPNRNSNPAAIARIPMDLSNFQISENLRNNGRAIFFLKVVINRSLSARAPMYHTPFYILQFFKSVDSLQKVDRDSLPKGVFDTFREEEGKILTEEKNQGYLYW